MRDAIGFGGGGSQSSHTPVVSEDSLQSRAMARLVFLLHEGPGEGFLDPLHPWRCITLDGTPVEGDTGEWNFPADGIFGQFSLGYPDQGPLDDFPAVELETAIGVEVMDKSAPGNASGSGAITRTITDLSADSARLRLSVGPLLHQASNGDVNPTSVDLQVWARPAGGAWSLQQTVKFSGKTSSRYQRSALVRLKALGNGPWDLKVIRPLADSTDSTLQNKTYWEALTTLQESQLTYANRVVVGLRMNSQQFSKMPTVGFRRRMQLVQVPTNYDPLTRSYDGIWDGTFKLAWTNNPAWLWYDLITEDRYGCGRFIKAARVDKWGLYGVARYCDELVPDGKGGMEPRFVCNLYLQESREAWQVVVDFAAIFRAMAFLAGGTIYASQDAPKDREMIFTAANTEDGRFTYSGTSDKTRYNRVIVWWNDPAQGYKRVPEPVEDKKDIRLRGLREKQITALGCTSQGQAARLGRWLIYSCIYETEICTWTTGLDGSRVLPGAIVEVQDPARASVRMGGRVKGATLGQLTLDAPFTLEAGHSYTLSVVLPDGSLVERGVTTPAGTTDTLDLATPLPELPVDLAVWTIRDNAVDPAFFRILSIREEEKHRFTIMALSHDPEKFAWVEQGNFLEAPTAGDNRGAPGAPTALGLSEGVYVTGADFASILSASWSTVLRATKYRLSWRQKGGNWVDLPDSAIPYAEVRGLGIGDYEVKVRALSALGRESTETTGAITLLGKTAAPADVTGLTTAQKDATLDIRWNEVQDLDRDQYELRTGASWAAGTFLARVKGTSYQWPLPSPGIYTVRIKALDTSGNYSVHDAVANVTISLSAVERLADDDLLSRAKKPAMISDYNAEIQTRAQLDAATPAGVSSTAYDNAVTALMAFLNGLTPTWTDTTQDTPLGAGGGATLRSKWSTVATTREVLRLSIGNAAAAAAQAAAISAAATDATSKSEAVLITVPKTVTGLPSLPSASYPVGTLLYETGAKRLYRATAGNTWESATTAAGDITGQIGATQISGVNADAISGQIADANLAAIAASKVTGQLTNAQIAELAAAKISGQLTNAQVAALDAAKLTGILNAAQVAQGSLDSKINALATTKLTGTVGADLIAANSIFSKHLTLANFYNLVPNWNSEMDTSANPTGVEANGIYVGVGHSGAKCRRVVGIGLGGDAYEVIVPKFSTIPGQKYLLEWWAMGASQLGSTTSNCGIMAYMEGADAYSTASGYGYPQQIISSYTWQKFSQVITALGQTLEVRLHAWHMPAGNFMVFDDFFMHLMSDASLIVDGSITAVEMAAGTITAASGILADAVISTAKIQDSAISTAKIANLAVDTAQIKDGAIINAKITNLDAGKINTGYLAADRIDVRTITGDKLVANAISANELAAGSVTTAKMTANSISGDRISAGTLDASKILADSITSAQIAANAIGAAEIAAGSIFARNLTLTNFDNLIPNGNCEMDLTNLPSGSVEGNGIQGSAGSKYRIIYGAGTGAGVMNRVRISPDIAMMPGERYILTWEQSGNYQSGTSTANCGLEIYMAGTDAWNTASGYGFPQQIVQDFTWRSCSQAFQIPAGAARVMFVNLVAWQIPTYSSMVFRNFTLRKQADANMIVDGTLQALFARISGAITSQSVTKAINNNGVPVGFTLSATPFASQDIWGNAFNALLELGGAINLQGFRLDGLGIAKLAYGANGNYVNTTPGSWSWTAPSMGNSASYQVQITQVGGGGGGCGSAGPCGGNSAASVIYVLTVAPGTVLSGTIGAGGPGTSTGNISGGGDTTLLINGVLAMTAKGAVNLSFGGGSLVGTLSGKSFTFAQAVPTAGSPASMAMGANPISASSGASGGTYAGGSGTVGGSSSVYKGGISGSGKGGSGAASAFGPGGDGASSGTAPAVSAANYGAGGGGALNGTGAAGVGGMIQIQII